MNRPTPAALLAALREGALSLHHQVQVHVPSARLSGVEAFVRWPHPALGLLGPAEVVPLVEEGALHESLDPWVIGELCRQVVRWRKARVPVPLVAANVWSQTLESPAFVDLVQDALRASGAEPTMLEIELPRGSLARDDLRATLADLHERGVRLAVDDVALGGPESEQPVDTFKLPRASSGSSETVARVVAAGRARVVRVVAEGVETAAEREALVRAGCDIVQGYVYGPEVSAAEVHAVAG